MDKLLSIDTGLMFWTIVTFLAMVVLLKKFAWGPLIHSIEERENRLKADREAAEKARAEAQRIQTDLEAKLAGIDAKSREVLAQAAKDADAAHGKRLAEAKQEADRLMEKTKAELEEEKRKLIVQLRSEVAGLAVNAAEKLIHKSVDDGVRKNVMDQFLKDIDSKKKN